MTRLSCGCTEHGGVIFTAGPRAYMHGHQRGSDAAMATEPTEPRPAEPRCRARSYFWGSYYDCALPKGHADAHDSYPGGGPFGQWREQWTDDEVTAEVMTDGSPKPEASAAPPVAPAPFDEMERGRCGSCRWWNRIESRRYGDCTNSLVADGCDSAFRGVTNAAVLGRLRTGDRFGCVHWHGDDCPTCGEPRRPK
ncbi:hypothetical protein K2Z84_05155 [Candidatus Binatia bacterium]|nr:hypothetical protein [Candidatus Binatia bacterium]